jgi:hypothetical protein
MYREHIKKKAGNSETFLHGKVQGKTLPGVNIKMDSSAVGRKDMNEF